MDLEQDEGQPDTPRQDDRVRELELVNKEYADLVQLLLDRLEGSDEESYAYSFQNGWKEKERDTVQEELTSDDLDAQLREIRQLKQEYSQ